VPSRGLGDRLNQIQDWLDQNAGTDGWAMTPSGRSPISAPRATTAPREGHTADKGGVGNKPLDRVSKAFNGDSVPDLDGHGA
jgi:hypothetical protein